MSLSPAVCAQAAAPVKPAAKKDVKPPAETDAEKQQAARKQLALDLIKRSYALDEQVADRSRLGLLNTQISVASKLDKELARAWAHELFERALEDKNTTAQFMAINALSRDDPEEGMSMLVQLDAAALAPNDHEFPGAGAVTMTPRFLFKDFAHKNGKAAMPKILATANAMGNKGRYPYAGVMAAAVETKDDGLIEHTARQLLARYQQRIDPDVAGFDFAEMLNYSQGQWPKELLKTAVELAVAGLQNYPVNDGNKSYSMKLQVGDGSATAHGPVEMGLLYIAYLIKRTDPELWTILLKTYPNLSAAPEGGPGAPHSTWTMSVSSFDDKTPPTIEEQKHEALMEIRRQVFDDPDKAEKIIHALSDPATRAEAAAIAAQLTADRYPEKSAAFAAEAERATSEIKDPKIQFKSACAQLHSDAANNNRAAIPDDLDKTFQLADKVMRKTRDEGHDTGYLISPLVEAAHDAIKLDPELTIAHIESIYLPYEKAQLLTAAASALATPVVVKPLPAKVEEAEKQAN